ncbi:AAA family ATPase [Deinococcus hohokamensis]|uniref:AAA family ATPase n=1 Tax=Deinococcus hohokamensis TaxID=309883 RepID=A0ABV9IAL1_9DEIO
MTVPLLLVISGLPAAGKTYLGQRLSRDLGWPLLSRDDFKRVLYAQAPDLPRPVAGTLSFEVMLHAARAILGAGGPVLLESHFWKGQEPALRALIQDIRAQKHLRAAQLFVQAPVAELQRRHAERVARAEQREIHQPFDHHDLPPEACWYPLDLAVPLLRLDTTRPGAYAQAQAWVNAWATNGH